MELKKPATIGWAPIAVLQAQQIKDYLFMEWGKSSSEKFERELAKTISTISNQPLGFKFYKKEKVRIALVVKQISLLYEYNSSNRMNPSKLKI